MAIVKYATEDNIRSLIALIRDELSNYVTKDEFENPSFGDSSGSGTSSNKFTVQKVGSIDGISGESGIIYLVERDFVNFESNNRYDEYIWIEDEMRFELLGPVVSNDSGSITIQKHMALPGDGEPNILYLVERVREGVNQCDEYIWDPIDERFELLGPVIVQDEEEILPE